MGNKFVALKESYQLLIESDKILKSKLDYEGFIKKISIDQKNEVILIEDRLGSIIQYDVCDCYTALIKIIKVYKDENINKIYKNLKDISLRLEIAQL